jgi:hypothetical protein
MGGWSDTSDRDERVRRSLGLVMGVITGVLIGAISIGAFVLWEWRSSSGKENRRADLEAAAHLRAVADALEVTIARGSFTDAEAAALVAQTAIGTQLVRVDRGPDELTVTLRVPRHLHGFMSIDTTELCSDLTFRTGTVAAGSAGTNAKLRDCRPDERSAQVLPPTSDPPAGAEP